LVFDRRGHRYGQVRALRMMEWEFRIERPHLEVRVDDEAAGLLKCGGQQSSSGDHFTRSRIPPFMGAWIDRLAAPVAFSLRSDADPRRYRAGRLRACRADLCFAELLVSDSRASADILVQSARCRGFLGRIQRA